MPQLHKYLLSLADNESVLVIFTSWSQVGLTEESLALLCT